MTYMYLQFKFPSWKFIYSMDLFYKTCFNIKVATMHFGLPLRE